jgi:hypothetical protein
VGYIAVQSGERQPTFLEGHIASIFWFDEQDKLETNMKQAAGTKHSTHRCFLARFAHRS